MNVSHLRLFVSLPRSHPCYEGRDDAEAAPVRREEAPIRIRRRPEVEAIANEVESDDEPQAPVRVEEPPVAEEIPSQPSQPDVLSQPEAIAAPSGHGNQKRRRIIRPQFPKPIAEASNPQIAQVIAEDARRDDPQRKVAAKAKRGLRDDPHLEELLDTPDNLHASKKFKLNALKVAQTVHRPPAVEFHSEVLGKTTQRAKGKRPSKARNRLDA